MSSESASVASGSVRDLYVSMEAVDQRFTLDYLKQLHA
jgi:hypothetical protein